MARLTAVGPPPRARDPFPGLIAARQSRLARLKPPFDAAHPLAADRMRKEFIFGGAVPDRVVVSPGFLDAVVARYRDALGLMRFLADAIA